MDRRDCIVVFHGDKRDVLITFIASDTSLLHAATCLVGFDALCMTMTLTTDA